MDAEKFNRAKEIESEIQKEAEACPILESRVNRFNDYIDFMDGRRQPITHFGKTYPKVSIKFTMSSPTETNVLDMFDMVEDNKKEWLDFLKKCQKNYAKKLEESKSKIEALKHEFESL